MKKIFILIFLFAFCACAQEGGNGNDSSVVTVEHRNPLLTVVSWPFVYIIQPAVEFMIYPVIPPLIYISREDLIEKGKNLITYGENGQIMFYPVINAKIGTASNIGFAYWHSDILLEHDNMFFSPHLYINADWDVTLRYKKKNILGSSFYVGFNTSHGEYGDNSFRDPMKGTYFFADSSIFLSIYSGFNLIGNWGLEFAIANNFYRYDFPNLNDAIIDNDEVSNRGFYRNFESHPLTISMLYNSLDEPYAATRGRKFSFGYSYVPVSAYSGSKDHNYHILESRLVNYTLLGHKSYAMTVAESNANRERLKNLSFSEAIEMFNPINVKEEVLDRRVLVTQVKARYMIEENKGKAPFTAMGRLGGNFPLRAYDDAYFTAPLVAGVSAEYRWPLDRFADMLIFNEYGIYGEDFDRLSVSNIKNSYGFGFRVRTPRFFVTRLALAFHGSQGITVVLTTRPEYD